MKGANLTTTKKQKPQSDIILLLPLCTKMHKSAFLYVRNVYLLFLGIVIELIKKSVYLNM